MKNSLVSLPGQYTHTINNKFIAFASALLLVLFSITGFAAEKTPIEQEKSTAVNRKMLQVKFEFEDHSIQFKIQMSKNSEIEVDPTSSALLLKTQSSDSTGKSDTKVSTLLIRDFKGLTSITKDINSLGYNFHDPVVPGGKKINNVTTEHLPSGDVYVWQTPTFGSSTYYYLQNPKDRQLAFKLGPFPDTMKAHFKIDWTSVKWIDQSK